MQTISATELARNTSQVLDRVATHGETVAVERNRNVIAEIIPPARTMTAAQALDGLGARLTPRQGARWLRDSRAKFDQAVRDPWA
jgi:antitoxin (DNA-binding transcriptional repressor) of toxin-antitoxin stability system